MNQLLDEGIVEISSSLYVKEKKAWGPLKKKLEEYFYFKNINPFEKTGILVPEFKVEIPELELGKCPNCKKRVRGNHFLDIGSFVRCSCGELTITNVMDSYSKGVDRKLIEFWQDIYTTGQKVPDYFYVYKCWEWEKIPPTRDLLEKLLIIGGYKNIALYFDGGDKDMVLLPWNWKGIALFIREFSTVDADAFDQAWPKFSRSGPGGLTDLMSFLKSE